MTAVHCSLSPWLWWRSLACTWRLEAEVTWDIIMVIMMVTLSWSAHQKGAGVRLLPGPDGAKHEASLLAGRTRLWLSPGVRQAQVLPVVDTSLVINLCNKSYQCETNVFLKPPHPLSVDSPLELSGRGRASGVARYIDQVPDLGKHQTCDDGDNMLTRVTWYEGITPRISFSLGSWTTTIFLWNVNNQDKQKIIKLWKLTSLCFVLKLGASALTSHLKFGSKW